MEDLTRYLRPRPRFTWPIPVCAIVMLALAVGILSLALGQHHVQQALDSQIAHLRAQQVVKPEPVVSKVELEDQKRWTAFKLERDFTWTPIFAGLQAAGNPDIELLEFQPDKASRRIQLRGEAKDEKALIAFIESLAGQPQFQNVYLSHRKNNTRGRLTTILFELKAAIK